MPPVARRLVIHGRVQGVGYRDAAVTAAHRHQVAGWVRNRADGTVEAFVQGSPEAVDAFVAWCRRGPPLARVSRVEVTEAALEMAHRSFEWHPSA